MLPSHFTHPPAGPFCSLLTSTGSLTLALAAAPQRQGPPTHGVAPAAELGHPPPPPCTRKRALTQDRAGKEFQKKMGQTVVGRAGPGQASVLTSQLYVGLALSIPLPLYFPHSFPPRSPSSFPLPAFGSSPKHPAISLMQSQTALPLHPIMCPAPLGSKPPLGQKGAWALTHLHGLHTWTGALRGQPRQWPPEGVSSSKPPICFLAWHRAPVLR